MFHCHSDYSLLDSCTKYQDYIDLAVEYGSKALSISEHGKPLNWTEKWAACKAAGVRYIHSVEIYLTEDLNEKIRDNYHTVLMAKNLEGVRELNKIVSMSCDKKHFYYTNRISFNEFLGLSDNIITTSACLASPLNKLPEEHPRFAELVNKYDFLEVQPHMHPDQIKFNKKLLRLSKITGKPLIAGTDTHSSSKYKNECRSVLLESKHKSYGDEDAFDLSYKTYEELVDMFRMQGALSEDEYLEAIENTNKLYDMTEDIELDTSIKYPILYGTREADSKKFTETVENKFKEKLEAGIIPENQETAFRKAIDEEMEVFDKLEMNGFMLSMSELTCWCKKRGMALGTARGSVGGSRVAYVTDIIDLNPETWHTVFSRFCNIDRKEIGDIDIDCVESDRPEIFEYITKRFGSDKTARVASFGTMQSRGVIDDVGRCLSQRWSNKHPNDKENNPWALNKIDKIKNEFELDPEKTRDKYSELFYYYDGLIDTKISQSVHPAGMVISPITLDDNFGVFDKDGELCLFLDMDNIHDFTGLAKYDFLVLKTVQVIRDTCNYLGKPYPKTHEINWNDEAVWNNMIQNSSAIFQFEGKFAFDCLKKFKPHNIFDMSLVTACIRPSGASYRDDLLEHKTHKNPSELIDKLLERNNGFLVYQEDIIAFLQQICGLTGSEADNIRRAIGRKDKKRLDSAMPSILAGYCEKSSKPKKEAEKEAKEFLQIIEDASSYMFGMNHSIAYCLLGYLCAYYRYYHPLEFITSFLNNAANNNDIVNGTTYANKRGIKVTMPKWGISRNEYFFDTRKRIIAKGLSSIKYMSKKVADELYELSVNNNFKSFMELISSIDKQTSIDRRQLEILVKIDYFSVFGNQRELLRMIEMYYDIFKRGQAKQINRAKVDGSIFQETIQKYSVGVTKTGGVAKNYSLLDVNSILNECETKIKSLGMDDLSDLIKVRNIVDLMGYMGYTSGKQEDRPKLYILDTYPLRRKKDGKQFGYSIITKSIGSGKESRFTVLNKTYNEIPIHKDDIVLCKSYTKEGQYYTLTKYQKLM